MDIVDAHLHFWDPSRLEYPWLRDVPGLNRPFAPSDLDTGGLPVNGFVFIEADCRPGQRMEEADWIIELAKEEPRLAAVVASAPLESPALLPAHLQQLKERPLVKGVRRLFQSEEASFLTDEATLEGAREVARTGLTFDACIRHGQLRALVAFATAVPELPIVLDHMGKPPIHAGERSPWQADLRKLAALPNTFVKLSGAAPEADPSKDLAEQALPYVEAALDAFGPGRCMFGSDWPVSPAVHPTGRHDLGYQEWVHLVLEQAMAGASADERAAVAGGTATRFYGIDTRKAKKS